MSQPSVYYPTFNHDISFSDYISQCQSFIKERRSSSNIQLALEANTPFELYPPDNQRLKYGSLLIHGLLDCPFTFREIGKHLQSNGILSKAVLLPGHGTIPSDLLSVTYQDWIKTVRYGITSLQKEVEQIFLIGYSTGGALSIYHALQDIPIAGIILIAPAIKIKVNANMMQILHTIKKMFRQHKEWIHIEKEIDYAKYRSIAFHPVKQVIELTLLNQQLLKKKKIPCPIHLIISEDDETIFFKAAIAFFSKQQHPNSRLIQYSSKNKTTQSPRVILRPSHYPNLNINNFSHISLPFSTLNQHYGPTGDFPYASRTNDNTVCYGAYNYVEEKTSEMLYQLGILKKRKKVLTYNPDFEFMMGSIVDFILRDDATLCSQKSKPMSIDQVK